MGYGDATDPRPVLPAEVFEQLERNASGISEIDVLEKDSAERTIPPELLDTAWEIPIEELPGDLAQPAPTDLEFVLDIEGFRRDVHLALNGIVAGYCLAVQVPLRYRFFAFHGLARKPANGVLSWNEQVPMHVASTSKFITAMALAAVFERRGLSLDTPIVDFLPQYWNPGANIQKITFRQVLDHRSGFVGGVPNNAGPVFFVSARAAVEAGVSNGPAGRDYENSNFTLLRILLPIVEGRLRRGFMFPPHGDESINDQAWDIVTRLHYEQIVNEIVFRPAGLTSSSDRRPGSAFAYSNNGEDELGFDSASMTALGLGTIGWQLNLSELMKVLEQFAIPGKIMSGSMRAELLSSAFRANDVAIGGALQAVFRTGGYWQHGSTGMAEANAVFLFPGDHEVALFVNSESSITAPLRDAFMNNFLLA